jgi:anthranilate synthase component 1
VAVIDNLSGRLYLIVWADPADAGAHAAAVARLVQLGERLRQGVTVAGAAALRARTR